MTYEQLVKRIGILEKQTKDLGLRIQKLNAQVKQYSESKLLREHYQMKADKLKQNYMVKIGILQELKKLYNTLPRK